MTTLELLATLRSKDVRLWVEGERLRYSALTPALRAQLAEAEVEILTLLRGVREHGHRPMLPVSRDGDLPLSFAQQRLWFLDQFEAGSVVYNITAAVRLTGPLKATVLEQSLNEIVRRHDVLRATFPTVDGQPYQVICPALPLRQAQGQLVTLSVVDLRELPEVEREAEARRLATAEAQRPFDLARGPLVRTAVLQLGDEDHILLLTMHHIVSDSWSTGVLFQELSVLYEAFSTGSPSPLPELTLQYADFARWQRQWQQGEVLEQQLSYWKQRLGDTLPVLELPSDRPRPTKQTSRGATHSLTLPPSLSESLNALSRQEEVTLSMTLLAAFQTLLYRYTGQDDIVVGTPIAGRNLVEVGGLIGFFVNTLVLRTKLAGNPSFRELLGRVREVVLGAYAHQDLPFEKLVEKLAAGAGPQPHAAIPGDVPVKQWPGGAPTVIRLERG
jgi:Condensation domain/TubC N-terminal docking domain